MELPGSLVLTPVQQGLLQSAEGAGSRSLLAWAPLSARDWGAGWRWGERLALHPSFLPASPDGKPEAGSPVEGRTSAMTVVVT